MADCSAGHLAVWWVVHLAARRAESKVAQKAESKAVTTVDHLVALKAVQKAANLAAYWAGKLVAW